jgi:hypothetical protein
VEHHAGRGRTIEPAEHHAARGLGVAIVHHLGSAQPVPDPSLGPRADRSAGHRRHAEGRESGRGRTRGNVRRTDDDARILAVPACLRRSESGPASSAPASKAPAPPRTAEPSLDALRALFESTDYAGVVRACTKTTVTTAIAGVCTLAACYVRDAPRAQRWLFAAPAKVREKLVARCKELGNTALKV